VAEAQDAARRRRYRLGQIERPEGGVTNAGGGPGPTGFLATAKREPGGASAARHLFCRRRFVALALAETANSFGGMTRLPLPPSASPSGKKARTATAVKSKAAPARRAWQRMMSGRRLDLLDPSALDVEIEDIAHGLARVARWNGQTGGPHIFSVAQHSLLVEALARVAVPRLDPKRRLAALLHDAPEYVIGDMISPFKAVIGDAYKAVEQRLLSAIHRRFGLPVETPPEIARLVKTADRQAAYLEATRLAGFEPAEARKFFGQPPQVSSAFERDYLSPWTADIAEARFLERFHKLMTG
jgi:hypothetical protein